MSKNKIAIFGARGFIGQHLVRALAAISENDIVAFDRKTPPAQTDESPFINLSNVTFLVGDFLSRESIDDALNGVDYVFHLVSFTTPATSNKDPFIDIDTNIRSSIELFELCVKHKVKKVIFPSSGGTIYGNIDSNLINEAIVPQPSSPYGIGKLTIEHYLRYFKFTSGLDYIIYRIANPYGPGQNIYGQQGVIPIFMHKFLTKDMVTIYGDGSMVRDYLYIDDLINMIIGSYKIDNKYSEYNIGTGIGESVNELFSIIKKCVGYPVEQKHIDKPSTFVDKSVLDTNRFVNEFGKPKLTPIEEGIARTWDYVKQLG